jgi:transcriptional regulator with XRE-family HTH domain
MVDKKQYENVSDLLRDIVPDEEFRAAFDGLVARRKLIKQLLALRAVKGMSQRDVAAAMNCTQSRVSKLENANDEDVRLGDLRAYAEALGCEFVACAIPRDMKTVEKVKCHAFAIKKHTDDMAQLARTDEAVAEGVAKFFYELFVNLILMLGDSAKRLPLSADGEPLFRLHVETGATCDEEPVAQPCTESGSVSHAAR